LSCVWQAAADSTSMTAIIIRRVVSAIATRCLPNPYAASLLRSKDSAACDPVRSADCRRGRARSPSPRI